MNKFMQTAAAYGFPDISFLILSSIHSAPKRIDDLVADVIWLAEPWLGELDSTPSKIRRSADELISRKYIAMADIDLCDVVMDYLRSEPAIMPASHRVFNKHDLEFTFSGGRTFDRIRALLFPDDPRRPSFAWSIDPVVRHRDKHQAVRVSCYATSEAAGIDCAKRWLMHHPLEQNSISVEEISREHIAYIRHDWWQERQSGFRFMFRCNVIDTSTS